MADKKKITASGDAADKPEKQKEAEKLREAKKKDTKDKKIATEELIEAEPEKTASQIAIEEALHRAELRRDRFKRRWPEVTKVKITTRPWQPPPPPQRMPPIVIHRPELHTRRWVPPYRRRRNMRPKLMRIPAEDMTKPLEKSTLRKIWHNFHQVDKNKMMLQGNIACNSKKRSSASGSQTGCIAVICRALLEEKTPAQLTRRDVDEVILAGNRYYKLCLKAMKCYKGKPELQLNQLLTTFFLNDTKYTVKMMDADEGLLAKHPDNIQAESDLMTLMDRRVGQTFMMILTIGGTRHFLVWGHPPTSEAGTSCRTVCYIFDPHSLNDIGQPNPLVGAGAFIRYAGVTSFVLDFLANYGDLDSAKKGAPKPRITLTNIDVVQKEPLIREPNYDIDLKAIKIHCRSEWDSINMNALIEKKRKEGKYPLCSLSAVSLATSRSTSRKKVRDFYQKTPKEPPPTLPLAPERAPPPPTLDSILASRGEDFFLYCPATDGHIYGRDDMIPRPKSETVFHSPVEIANKNYHSQFNQVDADRWILRGTRHMASFRYQTFKTYTAIACCVAALGMLRRLRARAWNEDVLDETLDIGYNLYRESLLERGGPIRRIVLGELNEIFRIRDTEYKQKLRGIAVWGRMVSNNPKVLDLCRGIENFFKEADSGVLQIPGEYETAIWQEGGRYYVYHPWPADCNGYKVGLQDQGKACLFYFTKITHMCNHLLESVRDMNRRPFSISDVNVFALKDMPEPVNKLKPVAPNRWIVRGRYHEGSDRFPEDRRGKQATPTSIAAIAMAHIVDPADWTSDDIDETLIRGDTLYQNTMEHLERMGISLESPKTLEEGEEEEEDTSGLLAAADVLNRFKISDMVSVETEVLDSAISGQLNPERDSGILSLKESLKQLFKERQHGVVTARGGSAAVWTHRDHLYYFDPHGCDEQGAPSDQPRAAAALIRIKGGVDELAAVIMGNLAPGTDDSFNISPVSVSVSRLVPELGAPETKLENKQFEWINKLTAAILMGPRGENTAIGKAADKVGVGADDMAGRTFALPAAAAFTAAAVSVPPPFMHQDHMYNFLDAGADYYLKHLKDTGKKEILPEDLTQMFLMGANTFSIELGEPIKLPLKLPDTPAPEGEEEGAADDVEVGEEEEERKEPPMKEIKEALFKMWYDDSKPSHASLLVGDYHQLGVWMAVGGKVVAFDPAPTMGKGMLTRQRILKGDEIRLQRLKEEMSGEGGDADEEEEEDEEVGGEGEEQPEPEPQFVPPEACPALMVFSSPAEFIDKLGRQGPLDNKQCLAPYKLYPVKVTNELTSVLKEKKGAQPRGEGDEGADEEEEEALVEPLDETAYGSHFTRLTRGIASLRGNVSQNEAYFMDVPNRDNQDAANAAMGIVVNQIEPYTFWKPQLIDAILKYGDRLYTSSLRNASDPPRLKPDEIQQEFHVTSFSVKLDMSSDPVKGDIKAGPNGVILNIKRGLIKFFETHKSGIFCSKDHCVGIWRGADDKSYCLWDPHSVGPSGRTSPGGAAAVVVFAELEDLAETMRSNVEGLERTGPNAYKITPVKVFWEISKITSAVTPQGAVPDEGYEWKVLTAYVETARGRTILRGSRPPDLVKFTREALLQSACGAIVAACMSYVRRSHLWTRNTVDEVMATSCRLFSASLGSLGYEFRPGDDVLLPLQVLKRFVLGVNYVRYDLGQVATGKLEQKEPSALTVRCALERFFESHTHGVLWSVPHAVAVWRVAGSPAYYMMEPHACGPTGLRIDAQDDGAACVLTFTSPKLMAFAYLQNIPVTERPKHDFQLYAMSIVVQPIKELGGVEPPLVKAPPGVKLVPATSKVGIDGSKRRALEGDRKHPPGSATCLDAQRAAEKMDEEQKLLKGQRNASGWLVLNDGTQFLSAQHSMACRKFPYGSRGNQAISCSIMAVAMSRIEDVCRWCSTTLDQILESGDQLYQDSYLHYKPNNKILSITQILRKFYTPGNCVCRVVVYQARQEGVVDEDLLGKLAEFFNEERAGVFIAGEGDFAVALFRTPRGYYMFDPADRDRYGRAVAPPCTGRARACFSQYPNVQTLAEKLGPNIPPVKKQPEDDSTKVTVTEDKTRTESPEASINDVKTENKSEKEVRFEEPAGFSIYGIDVTSLRKLNEHEK